MIGKATKKPIAVEFIPWIEDNAKEVAEFVGAVYQDDGNIMVGLRLHMGAMAHKGDYILKGIQGEFYPVKADIFHAMYDVEGENYSLLENLRDAIQQAEELGLVRLENGSPITGAIQTEYGIVLTGESNGQPYCPSTLVTDENCEGLGLTKSVVEITGPTVVVKHLVDPEVTESA